MRALLLLVLLLALPACTPGTSNTSTTSGLVLEESNADRFAAWTNDLPRYRIGPGDKLRVQFLLTPDMSEQVTVSPDGSFSLRVAGRIEADNATTDEIEARIARASRRVLNNPIVTVGVEETPASVVYVGGQVNRAGAYPLAGRRGLMEHVLLAGGLQDTARMDQVALIRRSPQGGPMLRTVNLQSFVNTGGGNDVSLQPGDIIFVPRSRIAELNLWIEQFVNRTLQINRSFNYTIVRNVTPGAGFF